MKTANASQRAARIAKRNEAITQDVAATIADLLAMQHAAGHTYDRLYRVRDDAVSALLAGAAAIVKATCYVQGHEASDADALGVAIAHRFEWDARVVACARSALEDANFHGVNRAIAAEVETWAAESIGNVVDHASYVDGGSVPYCDACVATMGDVATEPPDVGA